MTRLQSLLALIPWWVKAGVVLFLIGATVNECQARDRAIARTALWQVSWDSTVAAKKLTEEQLKAAKDTARLLVAQATRKEADFQAELGKLRSRKSKVVVIHDTVPGEPLSPPDTIEQADLPIVKACTATVEKKNAALPKCQLVNILLAQQHAEDSVQLRLAFRKPQPSRARDVSMGAGVGVTTLLVILHFFHAHF